MSNSRDEVKQIMKEMTEVVETLQRKAANLATKGDVTELEMEEAIQERHIEELEEALNQKVDRDEFKQLNEEIKHLRAQLDHLTNALED